MVVVGPKQYRVHFYFHYVIKVVKQIVIVRCICGSCGCFYWECVTCCDIKLL